MDEETRDTQQPERQQQEEQTPGGVMTFDQMLESNPAYRSEFDRRMTKGIATAKTNWEQEQADQQDEAKRLEKMTTAQRERYQLEQDRKALAAQQAAFAAEQMKVSVGAELQKRGLDAGFAPYLAGKTAEESNANLDAFQAMFQTALAAAVTGRMRGTEAPPEPRGREGNDPFLSGFKKTR